MYIKRSGYCEWRRGSRDRLRMALSGALLHASSAPAVLSTATAGALTQLRQAKLLQDDIADTLMSSLTLWQSLQSIIRLTGPERLDGGIPPAGQTNALCRAGGVETFDQLKEHMSVEAERTRGLLQHILVSSE